MSQHKCTLTDSMVFYVDHDGSARHIFFDCMSRIVNNEARAPPKKDEFYVCRCGKNQVHSNITHFETLIILGTALGKKLLPVRLTPARWFSVAYRLKVALLQNS